MKVIEEKFDVEQGGSLIEVSAAIKATAKAFHVLSSNLYSDKILAVVRELSCNAWDSHVSAGKVDTPIDVHLPTSLDCTFYVKDYGIGMSDFDVRGCYIDPNGNRVSIEEGHQKPGYTFQHGVYTTFFDSTKTNSNEVIGQLGLGSKSPYAYASTFTVESRFNGTKRIYTCYKNVNNEPAITMLDTSDTDECNGMTISMAVNVGDMGKFAEAARKALMYFQPKPNVLGQRGVIPYSLEHKFEGTNWKMRTTEWSAHMHGGYVVQGFVAYPIDVSQLEQNGLSQTAATFARCNVDVFVPIGDVEVAPSREALSYDKRTIKNLNAALEAAALEVRESFQKTLDECTSVWTMLMLHDEMVASQDDQMKRMFELLRSVKPFNWKGKPINENLTLDLEKIEATQIQVYKLANRSKMTARSKMSGVWTPGHVHKAMTLSVVNNTHILIDTEPTGNAARIANFLLEKDRANRKRAATVFVLRPLVKGGTNIPEMMSIIEDLGGPEPVYTADLPAPYRPSYKKTASKTPAQRAKLSEYHVFTGFRQKTIDRSWRSHKETIRKFSRLTWDVRQVDLAAGGVYFKVEKYAIYDGAAIDLYVDNFLLHATALGFVSQEAEIPGFTDKDLEKIDKTKWKNIYDVVREKFEATYVATNSLNTLNTAYAVEREFPSAFIKHVVEPYERGQRYSEGAFEDLVKRVAELHNVDASKAQHIDYFADRYASERKEDQRPSDLGKEFANLRAIYKYFPLFDWHAFDSVRFKLLLQYIAEVDAKNASQADKHSRVEEELENGYAYN